MHDSLLRELDRNIVEICDNVNTIPAQHPIAQDYIWASVYVIVYCSILVKHRLNELILYILTRVRRKLFN